MPRTIVLHADGSQVRIKKGHKQATGWAVVACQDDVTHERHGAILEGRHGALVGYHEQLAIIHAFLYAHEQGFAFEDVTLFCDDAIFGYATTYLSKENHPVRARPTG